MDFKKIFPEKPIKKSEEIREKVLSEFDSKILRLPIWLKDNLLYLLTICILFIVLLETFQYLRARAQRHMPRVIDNRSRPVILKPTRLQ